MVSRFGTSRLAGNNGRSDDEQLAYAIAQEMVLVTYNRKDFMRLHIAHARMESHHSGILLLFQNRFSIGEEIRRLRRFVERRSAEQMRDAIVHITSPDFAS